MYIKIKQMTLNSFIQIHALDIGIHYRRALVVYMLYKAIDKGVITLLLIRLIPFLPRTK